jgi:hypothetical protein
MQRIIRKLRARRELYALPLGLLEPRLGLDWRRWLSGALSDRGGSASKSEEGMDRHLLAAARLIQRNRSSLPNLGRLMSSMR